MVGDRVGLQEGQERLLDREIAGVAGRIDVVAAGDQARLEIGLDEAPLVGRQPGVAHRRHVGREGDQVVVAARVAVGVADLLRAHLDHDLVPLSRDPARGELLGHQGVEPRPERLDVAVLVRGPPDVDVVAGVLAPQPGLEHEDDLVQRAGALVVGRYEEQHSLVLAPPRGVARLLESAAHLEHRVRGPDRRRVLLQPRDLLRVRVGAGGDDELVVAQSLAVAKRHELRIGIDVGHAARDEVDVAAAQRLVQIDEQRRRVGPERHVDAVGPERELVAGRHQADVHRVMQSHAQQERRLECGEPAAEHEDLGLDAHDPHPDEPSPPAHPE